MCFYRPTKSSSRKTQKKKEERGHYPAILTVQAWSIKVLLYGQTFCICRFLLQNKSQKLVLAILKRTVGILFDSIDVKKSAGVNFFAKGNVAQKLQNYLSRLRAISLFSRNKAAGEILSGQVRVILLARMSNVECRMLECRIFVQAKNLSFYWDCHPMKKNSTLFLKESFR